MSASPRYPRPPALAQLGPGHNVVESSAGTGKTFLLEHLFVDLIVSRAVPIDQILVVTFTEKATAELVLRLRRLLGELCDLDADHPKAKQAAAAGPDESWLIDAAAKERLGQALLSFDRASISTIHGFCQRILREHSFVQGRLFDEGLVAEEVVIRNAFRELLRTHAGGSGALARVLRVWLDGGNTIAELEKLLCECAGKDAREIRPAFDEERLARAVRALPLAPADEVALTSRLKQQKLRANTIGACVERLAWLAQTIAANQSDPIGLLGAEKDGEDLAKVLTFVEERLAKAAADATLANLTRAIAALHAATIPLEAVMAQTWLPLIRQRAAANKRRTGNFDFADMLDLVSRALADDSPIREALLQALRRRYRFALIDEFQDTDETQWSIFRRIFVESPDGHALTVIGDPKQAIYGFRGANVLAYLEARQALCAANAGRIELNRNFRSTADLISAQNLLFAQEAGFFRPESGIRYDRPVSCGSPERVLDAPTPAVAAPVVVLGLLSTQQKSLRTPEAQAALQATIVTELRALVGPSCGLRLRGRPDGPAIRPRDIFVLTFTNAESRAIGKALGRAGIPFAFYRGGKLFESPEAEEILWVLRAIARPEDRGLCARAFLTRFFDLDLAETAACIDAKTSSEPTLRLHGWAALARKGDLPSLFASLLDDSGILRREIFANAGERALTNTMHVLEVLQAEWARRHATLPELVELLSAYIRGTQALPGRESDVQRLETEKDAVQILTVHTAKGLEADVVFLYGGTGEAGHQPSRAFQQQGVRVLYVGTPDPATKRASDDDKTDERSRLLYVAFTRARYRLYVPHYPATFGRLSGPYGQANRHIERILGADLGKPSPLFAVRTIDCSARLSIDTTATEATVSKPIPVELLDTPTEPADLAPIRNQRSGFLVTSYSAVKRAHGGAAPRPHGDGDLAADLGSPRRAQGADELPGGAKAGIFLHEILAAVSLPELGRGPAWSDWFASPGVAPLLQRLALRHGRAPGEIEPSARLVHLAYTGKVRLGQVVIEGLAKAKPSLREMEFHFPIPALAHPLLSQPPHAPGLPPWRIERGVVKGFVDFMFEHGGRIYVCDWKSDILPGYTDDVLGPHCKDSYQIQARIYTVATLRLCGIASASDFERRFGGMFFCFLRGLDANADSAGIHCLRPDWAEVLSWEQEMLDPHFWGAAT
jgi:exodeoxyribonuclease V beta subunit